MLIVFEGIDGAGKNTQIKKLIAFFRQNGVKFRLHKYPTQKAKEAFLHLNGKKTVGAEELAEIFAGDILAEREKIEREIKDGLAVICDRYLHSTLAYQGAKMDFDSLWNALEAKGAIAPDLVVVLDVAPGTGARRKSAQKTPDRFEKDVRLLSRVRENYLKMAREHFLAYRYVVVDASKAPDEVFSEIITQVEPLAARRMEKGG